METIKQILFTNWHFMRWLRLGLGIMIGVQAIQYHQTILFFLSGFLLFQAVTNTGSCGAGSCAASQRKTTNNAIEEIKFEEVREK